MIRISILFAGLLLTVCRPLVCQEKALVGIRFGVNHTWMGSEFSDGVLQRQFGGCVGIWTTPRLVFEPGVSMSYFGTSSSSKYDLSHLRIRSLDFPLTVRVFTSHSGRGFHLIGGFVAGNVRHVKDQKNDGPSFWGLNSRQERWLGGMGMLFKAHSSWITLEAVFERGLDRFLKYGGEHPINIVRIQIGYALSVWEKGNEPE